MIHSVPVGGKNRKVTLPVECTLQHSYVPLLKAPGILLDVAESSRSFHQFRMLAATASRTTRYQVVSSLHTAQGQVVAIVASVSFLLCSAKSSV